MIGSDVTFRSGHMQLLYVRWVCFMSETSSGNRGRVSMRRGLLGAAALSFQNVFLNALSVPAMAYIIRALGPSSYGAWATATSQR